MSGSGVGEVLERGRPLMSESLVVGCEGGWMGRGDNDQVVEATPIHAQPTHADETTREDVLAKAWAGVTAYRWLWTSMTALGRPRRLASCVIEGR